MSCHVEAALDDRVWDAFSRFQAARPGGFRIAALMRAPHESEDDRAWAQRAREAAARGPLGHHTHFTSPEHARPTGPAPAERVRQEVERFRAHELEPTLYCGGAWYMDADVAEVVAAAGYADCSALAFRPRYLADGAPHLRADAPTRVRLTSGRTLLELPSTHSLGMAARAAFAPGALREPLVHVYFHATDLLDRRRWAALTVALRLVARRRRVSDLDAQTERWRDATERAFADVYAR